VDTRDIAKISTEQVARRVMENAAVIESCDTFFISCTQLLTMDVIEKLESKLGKPVITSNQCSLWAGLKLAGAPAARGAPGTIFRN
jgi:maleate isomerase